MRDDKGRFVAGNSGGGRPKGSRNQKTEKIRDELLHFVAKNIQGLQKDFDGLKTGEKMKYLIELMKFTVPQVKAVTFGDILDEVSPEDLQKIIEKLKNQNI